MTKAEAMREKRILHLTLYRHWFVQIMKGLKVEEYRRRTSYWVKRLIGRGYDEVHFRNGYAKNAPFMRVEFKGVKDGDPIAVQLGRVLEVRNEVWPTELVPLPCKKWPESVLEYSKPRPKAKRINRKR